MNLARWMTTNSLRHANWKAGRYMLSMKFVSFHNEVYVDQDYYSRSMYVLIHTDLYDSEGVKPEICFHYKAYTYDLTSPKEDQSWYHEQCAYYACTANGVNRTVMEKHAPFVYRDGLLGHFGLHDHEAPCSEKDLWIGFLEDFYEHNPSYLD